MNFIHVVWRNFYCLFAAFILLASGTLEQNSLNAAGAGPPIENGSGSDEQLNSSRATVTSRGPHETEWATIREAPGILGATVLQTNRFVQLETGLNYEAEPGVWAEASQTFEINAEGKAEVSRGQFKVVLAASPLSDVPVQLTTPTGDVLKSRVIGLAYFDPASGNSELIFEVQDTIGEVNGATVTYPAALTDIEADLIYTYSRGSFEQDIVLRTQLPDVEGFDDSAQLEVWTEFLNPPEPAEEAQVRTGTNSVPEDVLAPNLKDRRISFGGMRIERGNAFLAGDRATAVPVGKKWERIDGRHFLVEKVNLRDLQPYLETLPPPRQPTARKRGNPRFYAGHQSRTRHLAARHSSKDFASLQGLVIDYVIATSATNYTLKGGETYYISGLVNISGVLTIEGGTVVKYTNANNAQIKVLGTTKCLTELYNPALFLSKDDITDGVQLPGSTNTPSGTYATTALHFDSAPSDLRNIRIRNAQRGILYGSGSGFPHFLQNAQFVDCGEGISSSSPVFHVRNALFSNVTNIFAAPATTAGFLEHVTIHKSSALRTSTNVSLVLMNSIVAEVADTNSFSGSNTVIASSAAGLFQSTFAGDYYLADQSSLRNAGSANISDALQQDFKRMTTRAPLMLSNVTIVSPTTFFPHVERDHSNYDLGYHYPVLDYLVGNAEVSNTSLLLTNGVVVGLFMATQFSGPPAISVNSGSLFSSIGRPDRRNVIVNYALVQEKWRSASETAPELRSIGINYLGGPLEIITCRFTDFLTLDPDDAFHFLQYGDEDSAGYVSLRDCQFSSGRVSLFDFTAVENCLFERGGASFGSPTGAANVFNNNLFFGGKVPPGSGVWTDNVFDEAIITNGSPSGITSSYNAYSGTNVLSGSSGNDLTNQVFVYESGPLGRFYQPAGSALANSGSRTAAAAGLYHHTTRVDQTTEGSSQVDRGYHYVAVTSAEQEVTKGTMTATGSDYGFSWLFSYAIDGALGDPGWHNGHYTEEPSYLRIDMGTNRVISRVGYIPRDGAADADTGFRSNGTFRQYAIYVTDNSSGTPANWGTEVAYGQWNWPNGKERRDVLFTPTDGRYVYSPPNNSVRRLNSHHLGTRTPTRSGSTSGSRRVRRSIPMVMAIRTTLRTLTATELSIRARPIRRARPMQGWRFSSRSRRQTRIFLKDRKRLP